MNRDELKAQLLEAAKAAQQPQVATLRNIRDMLVPFRGFEEYRAHLLEAAKAAQQPRPRPSPPRLPDVPLHRMLMRSAANRGKHLADMHKYPPQRQQRLMAACADDFKAAEDWLEAAGGYAVARGGKSGQSLMVDLRHHRGLLEALKDGFSVETAPERSEAWTTCFLHLVDSVERARWMTYRPLRKKY